MIWDWFPSVMTGVGTVGLCFFAWWQSTLVGRSTKAMEKSVGEAAKTRSSTLFLTVCGIIEAEIAPQLEVLRAVEEKRAICYVAGEGWIRGMGDSIFSGFERIGCLCRRGFLDVELVADFYGELVQRCWAALEEAVYLSRQDTNPRSGIEFEWLAKECTKYLEQSAPTAALGK